MGETQNPNGTWPALADLPERWDLIILGGGITGAGILLEAVRRGLKTLLLEGRDFAWGTSSRSSKLVHGGLRYLRQGRLGLTRASVVEREHLLDQAPGLVEPLDFLVPLFKGRKPGRTAMRAGLKIYDLIAGRRTHRFLDAPAARRSVSWMRREGLTGAYRFQDAQTDDARLVLRIVQEARDGGGAALNYTAAIALQRDRRGRMAGVAAQDIETGATRLFLAPVLINATGVWAERLHRRSTDVPHLRPLRGSHLVLPAARLPLNLAVSFWHPGDDRGVFVLPWHDAVLVGTTDLDHDQDLDQEPRTSRAEIEYLLAAVNHIAPEADIGPADIICTQAGVRPVVAGHKDRSPSDESREHAVWTDQGLITVTGGKLTTFRRLAFDALEAAAPWLPATRAPDRQRPVFDPVPQTDAAREALDPAAYRRLSGRHGRHCEQIVARAPIPTLTAIPGTSILWAELVHAAANEAVRHLTDLLLRRVRLGLIRPAAGRDDLPQIRRLCQPVLGWDDTRWEAEARAYLELWERCGKVASQPD